MSIHGEVCDKQVAEGRALLLGRDSIFIGRKDDECSLVIQFAEKVQSGSGARFTYEDRFMCQADGIKLRDFLAKWDFELDGNGSIVCYRCDGTKRVNGDLCAACAGIGRLSSAGKDRGPMSLCPGGPTAMWQDNVITSKWRCGNCMKVTTFLVKPEEIAALVDCCPWCGVLKTMHFMEARQNALIYAKEVDAK